MCWGNKMRAFLDAPDFTNGPRNYGIEYDVDQRSEL